MPTRVENRSIEAQRNHFEKFSEHDSAGTNRNVQHKEALRLALGSILAPKRPYTPTSHSSSGSASPAPSSTITPALLPTRPDSVLDGRSDSHLHPRATHLPHTPSRLGQSDSKEPHWPTGSSPISGSSSMPVSPRQGTQNPLPIEDCPVLSLPPPVIQQPPKRPSIYAPKAASAPTLSVVSSQPCITAGSDSRTPRPKFLETLESKSAWEALIHGSFS